MTSKTKRVRHLFSLILNVAVFFCVLWCLSAGSVRPNDLNHLLSCFVEYWRRWPEFVSAVMLRVVAECFVCNVMVVVVEEFFWNCHGLAKCKYNDCILYLFGGKMSRSWGHKLLIMCLILLYLPCEIWNNPCIILVYVCLYCSSSKPIRISRLVTRGERRRVK